MMPGVEQMKVNRDAVRLQQTRGAAVLLSLLLHTSTATAASTTRAARVTLRLRGTTSTKYDEQEGGEGSFLLEHQEHEHEQGGSLASMGCGSDGESNSDHHDRGREESDAGSSPSSSHDEHVQGEAEEGEAKEGENEEKKEGEKSKNAEETSTTEEDAADSRRRRKGADNSPSNQSLDFCRRCTETCAADSKCGSQKTAWLFFFKWILQAGRTGRAICPATFDDGKSKCSTCASDCCGGRGYEGLTWDECAKKIHGKKDGDRDDEQGNDEDADNMCPLESADGRAAMRMWWDQYACYKVYDSDRADDYIECMNAACQRNGNKNPDFLSTYLRSALDCSNEDGHEIKWREAGFGDAHQLLVEWESDQLEAGWSQFARGGMRKEAIQCCADRTCRYLMVPTDEDRLAFKPYAPDGWCYVEGHSYEDHDKNSKRVPLTTEELKDAHSIVKGATKKEVKDLCTRARHAAEKARGKRFFRVPP